MPPVATTDRHEEGTCTGVLATGTRHILFLPRLTIRKLAAALQQMEKNKSYAHALACVDLLDYESVCALADTGGPDNDPNLMPSRYMILRGATDAGLKQNGNLDDYPYPLGNGMPKEMGCQALADFLVMAGALTGGSPAWWKAKSGSEAPREFPGCDQEWIDAYIAFTEGSDACYPLYEIPDQHTVSDGETLASIAEIHGIRSWTLIWELNKDSLSSPSDALQKGSTLKLPSDSNLDIAEFEDWMESWTGVEPADPWGYHDPRTVLLDESGRFVYRFAEVADCHFLSNGFVPLLSGDADLPQAIAAVVRYSLREPDLGCLVLGHCDPADTAEDLQELSLRRGQAIQAILGLDAGLWLDVVRDASEAEIQASLSGIASVTGWDCDPSTNLDSLAGAVSAFRSGCNDTYALGLDDADDWTELDWKAVHRLLCGLVAQRMLEPDPPEPGLPQWPDIELESVGEDGTFACGDSYPIPDDLKPVYTSRTHRRVEIVFAPAPLFGMGASA